MSAKKIVVTIGDPCGLGPWVSVAAISKLLDRNIEFYLIGSKATLDAVAGFDFIKDKVNMVYLDAGSLKFLPGQPSRESGQAALLFLNTALNLIKEKNITRLVTAPLSKEMVQLALPEFVGHTEYLADYFRADHVDMMMVSNVLKTVLLTRHIILKNISAKLNKLEIKKTIELTLDALKDKFGVKNPKVCMASVNPHAGINTFLEEEDELIKSAVDDFKGQVFGPYPGDTVFIQENLIKYDCIICAYHDQAMIPFKLLSMKDGVNLTLGLPIIRTSPAHGTAFDIIKAGKKPFCDSMVAAIELAAKLKT